ncbi:MAG: uracil phosphoribosyltransferase, partial [Campylobacteraceae bacterium]|nr:uracil phosphoribosyltransferase [Campylobacteraceae bacterium]
MENVHVITHPLIEHKLSILRDAKTESFQFRMLVDEITYLLLFEAARDLPLKDVDVQTPVASAKAKQLACGVMICPILRAALGMLESVFHIIPDASVGFLGFQRNEKTLEPEFYYAKLPSDHKDRIAIIIDPMFATGGTAIDAVNFLKSKGIKDIRFLSIIS